MVKLLLLLGIATASGQQTDAGWDLLATTSGPETPRTCYVAPKLPAGFDGSFYIAGPAKFEVGKYKFGSLFDGFGKENKFELSEGKVCYTSHWMNTGFKETLEKLGEPRGILFEDTIPPRPSCPMLDPICNMKVPSDNNWVSMIKLGDGGNMLSDTPTFLKLDLETLNNTGVRAWSDDKAAMGGIGPPSPNWVKFGHVGAAGSAHPLLRPGTDDYVDIIAEAPMVNGLMHNYLDIYTFSASGEGPQARKEVASIKMESGHYFHSFGVTPNYTVFIYDLTMDMFALTNPIMLGHFRENWQKINVFDKNGKPVAVFDTEPFTHAHIVNTFENATGIVMDVPAQSSNPFVKSAQLDIAMFMNKTARDTQKGRTPIRRFHLHLAGPLKGQTTSEDLTHANRALEFPKVNPAVQGLPYCIYYAVEWFHNEKDYASMAIMKHDICNSKITYWAHDDKYVSEPFFIGGKAAGAEDDGLLVFLMLDGRLRKQYFVILNAKTMQELEVIELPQHIPFTAHGQFIPKAAATQTVIV